MKKFCLFVLTLFLITNYSTAFAKKPTNLKIKKGKNLESLTTTTQEDTTAKEAPAKEKPKKDKLIEKILIPGLDDLDLQVQGIAYIPGDEYKTADGNSRYVLLSFFPNPDITTATAASQIVLIDREAPKGEEAIKRFTLFSNLKTDYEAALEKGLVKMGDDGLLATEELEKAKSEEETDTNVETATSSSTETATDTSTEEKTETSKKAFVLKKYRGHCGGIAVAGNYLWVASGFAIRGYDLKDITDFIADTTTRIRKEEGIPDKFVTLPAKDLFVSKKYGVDARASFLSFDGDYLWVGDYVNIATNSESLPVDHHVLKKFSEHKAWVAGYKVDKEKDLGYPTSTETYKVTYKKSKKGEPVTYKDIHKPDVVIPIRKNIQGMVIADKFLVLSRSCGIRDSRLLFFENPLTASVSDKKSGTTYTTHTTVTYSIDGKEFSVEAYDTNKENKVTEYKKINKKGIPAQIQDLEFDGKYIYVPFTSASARFKANHKKKEFKSEKNFYLINLEKLNVKKSKAKKDKDKTSNGKDNTVAAEDNVGNGGNGGSGNGETITGGGNGGSASSDGSGKTGDSKKIKDLKDKIKKVKKQIKKETKKLDSMQKPNGAESAKAYTAQQNIIKDLKTKLEKYEKELAELQSSKGSKSNKDNKNTKDEKVSDAKSNEKQETIKNKKAALQKEIDEINDKIAFYNRQISDQETLCKRDLNDLYARSNVAPQDISKKEADRIKKKDAEIAKFKKKIEELKKKLSNLKSQLNVYQTYAK